MHVYLQLAKHSGGRSFASPFTCKRYRRTAEPLHTGGSHATVTVLSLTSTIVTAPGANGAAGSVRKEKISDQGPAPCALTALTRTQYDVSGSRFGSAALGSETVNVGANFLSALDAQFSTCIEVYRERASK